jgi:hypothetical protein
MNFLREFPQWPFPVPDWLDPLDTPAKLVAEDALLDNGVSEYTKDVIYGGAYLFAVTSPERATLLLWYCDHCWNFEDVLGRGGQQVSAEARQRAEIWIKNLPQ